MEWNKLVPELLVKDYQASQAFYRDIFGFSLRFERPEDRFGYFDLEGAQLMLLQAPGAAVCGLHRPGPNGKAYTSSWSCRASPVCGLACGPPPSSRARR